MEEQQEQQVKECPFTGFKELCRKEDCPIYVKLQQQVLGVNRVIGLCSLPAIVMLLGNRPPQQAPPPQKLNLPNLRG